MLNHISNDIYLVHIIFLPLFVDLVTFCFNVLFRLWTLDLTKL